MKQDLSRIANTALISKITNANHAASLIKDGMVVVSSVPRISPTLPRCTLLSPSTADSLLENLDLPFFFAHH
ncbi:hypothetical protein [Dyadobacter sp. CY343]|uniref:hypothetical protein n=1 Tax=Dyadobacter sp. CY343 TaxID=2907299 RepID=UPI001F27B63D|nr:hypothetical protein [Dyadobacter sp. CY343]MCE7059412.1 hypothetical protein [Dyadobacter sp. CY343]